jgi:hypothetical protein
MDKTVGMVSDSVVLFALDAQPSSVDRAFRVTLYVRYPVIIHFNQHATTAVASTAGTPYDPASHESFLCNNWMTSNNPIG